VKLDLNFDESPKKLAKDLSMQLNKLEDTGELIMQECANTSDYSNFTSMIEERDKRYTDAKVVSMSMTRDGSSNIIPAGYKLYTGYIIYTRDLTNTTLYVYYVDADKFSANPSIYRVRTTSNIIGKQVVNNFDRYKTNIAKFKVAVRTSNRSGRQYYELVRVS
jgi:hypothetical protein